MCRLCTLQALLVKLTEPDVYTQQLHDHCVTVGIYDVNKLLLRQSVTLQCRVTVVKCTINRRFVWDGSPQYDLLTFKASAEDPDNYQKLHIKARGK